VNLFYLPGMDGRGSADQGRPAGNTGSGGRKETGLFSGGKEEIPEEKKKGSPEAEPGEVAEAVQLEVTLGPEESLHAVKVLRLREGDRVVVVDGRGGWYEGEIAGVHPKHCRVVLDRLVRNHGRRPYGLHVAMAPTKNGERTDWFLEKATEIGLDAFTPLICRHSERRQTNPGRLEKVAVAAMKQSLKARLPEIAGDTPFEKLLEEPFEGGKFIAHCYPGEKPHLKELVTRGDKVLVLIGPEGDFSHEEVEMALAAGFREVSLGRSRLRTETAALVACHTVALVNE
jgi:16S rRNA (uracil1498-N3)-methyltransferase